MKVEFPNDTQSSQAGIGKLGIQAIHCGGAGTNMLSEPLPPLAA